MRIKSEYIEQGRVLSTHGIRGEVNIEVWCDDFKDFSVLKNLYFDPEGKTSCKITSIKGGGKFAAVKLCGVDSVEDAAKLRGKTVYAARTELKIPEGKFLICDLIGLPVTDIDTGKVYGNLCDVVSYPASDVYIVSTPNGEIMIPDVPQFIKKLSDEGIFISPIEGMFE